MPNFDPMTGEPINNNAEQPVNTQPVSPEAVESSCASEVTAAAPAKAAKALGIPAIAGIAAAVVVVIAVALCAVTGVFGSPKTKAAKATTKTFEELALLSDLTSAASSTGKKATVSVDISAYDYDVFFSAAVSGNDKEIYAMIDGGNFDKNAVTIRLDKKALSIALSDFNKKYFTYNYTNPGDGYITEEVPEKYLEIVNKALKALYEVSADSDASKEMQSVIKEFYDDIEVKDAKERKFKVAGEKREVSGYTAVIEGSDIADLYEDLMDISMEQYKETLESVGYGDLWEDIEKQYNIEDVRKELEKIDEIAVSFYVYKGKLAAIVVGTEEYDREVQILFKGEDFRCQNIEVVLAQGKEEQTALVIKVKRDGSKDKYIVSIPSESDIKIEFSYDSKSGEYTFEYEDEWYKNYYGREESVSVKGKIEASSSKFSFSVDKVKYRDETIDVSGTVTISNSASFKKMSGKEVALDTLDEDDLKDLAEEVMEEYEDIYKDVEDIVDYIF